MASVQDPGASGVAFDIFRDLCLSLKMGMLPYAENAQILALNLLRNPDTPAELRPRAVSCFGHLANAVGEHLPHLHDMLALLASLAASGVSATFVGAAVGFGGKRSK